MQLSNAVDPVSAEFAANRDHMLGLIEGIEALCAQAAVGGGPRAESRYRARGKLPVTGRYRRHDRPWGR